VVSRNIKVEIYDGSSLRTIGSNGVLSSKSGDVGQNSTQRWLQTTDAIAERVHNIWNKLVSSKGRKSQPEVVVAVIDDGVDNTTQRLIGSILTGRTYGSDPNGERLSPWYVSENGHGTVMASMIHRVCPMVKIYPIRLRTSTRHIDVKSAIKAIDAAVERKVDIISMSWTVTAPTGDLKREFDKALNRAIENEVLMFCSCKDSGYVNDSYYPAGFNPDEFIKVGAASPSGQPFDMAGSLNRLDFIFPGVEVAHHHLESSPAVVKIMSETTSETGSSVATALGAGLAALIMYCAQIGLIHGTVGLSEADVQRLHQRKVMVEAIGRLGRGSAETDGKFIEVWQQLDEPAKKLAGGTDNDKREIIAQLARDLVRKST
jgi:hypothetical protein